MAWTIELDERTERDLTKLDKPVQRRILQYLQKSIAPAEDATAFGHRLTHNLSDLWRFRVGDYRILCRIEGDRVIVLVIAINHRRSIYERQS